MSGKKMSGKQAVAGAADLDAFISGADAAPAAENTEAEQGPRGIGRPKMKPTKIRSKSLQIKLTEEEFAKLEEESGYAAISTYARARMKEAGII